MAPALSPSQIAQLRTLLARQLRALETLLGSAQIDTRPVALDQQAVGRVSRIDAIQQQQMALAGRQQAAAQRRDNERALQRIDSGSYGVCEDCGEAIAFARLQAQPGSCLCIDCQSARESAT